MRSQGRPPPATLTERAPPLGTPHTGTPGCSPRGPPAAQPWPASRGGNASRVPLSLFPPPRGLSAAPVLPLRPCQWCRPGPPRGGPPVGACDSGLSQAEAGCQPIHRAARNLTLLFIGSTRAGPAWREEVAAAGESGEWEQPSQNQGEARPCRPLRLPGGFQTGTQLDHLSRIISAGK